MDSHTAGQALETPRILERLEAAVRRVCPAWLAAQSDDIVQKAWLRIAETLRKSPGNDPLPSSYIWKVAHSVTVDEIRKARRLREEHLDPDHSETIVGTDDIDPERSRTAAEIGGAIRSCLERLIAPRRRVMGLYLLGHGLQECSRMMGETYKRTEYLVLRGLGDLRSCLQSKGIHP